MISAHKVCIGVGGIAIQLSTTHQELATMLRNRYNGFLVNAGKVDCEFEIEAVPPHQISGQEDISVARWENQWVLERGDFRATWAPCTRTGFVRQTVNPYSIDSVLRIVHSIILANEGGFLLHASSVIRNGRAFLFSGVSGAGKTTISRLAPPDVVLLTDEVSYIRHESNSYCAYGTPFAGELAKNGENTSSSIATAFFLVKGLQNKVVDVTPAAAVRKLLRNVLFFAHDPKLVGKLFETAVHFAAHVPVKELTFSPESTVWDLIT
jgi:hypothetical protein